MIRAACTIIAKNYTAFARTLAQSFFTLHPDGKFYVLIVDEFEGYINPDEECFELVRLSDLGIPNLLSLCFKYDIKELCTAVKADLLDYLLRKESVERLIYLDPDILVTGSLNELYERLGTSDIVLTPHLDKDYPDDDLLPNDGYILRAGQFNLGFIGVNASKNALDFLKWWKPKLHENCVVDLLNGYFVDQKFIDFVPIFFRNIWIETSAGYNVAYWNLHSRTLSHENGSWRCNDGPLYFFHFSGYKPEGAGLTGHVPVSMARHLLSNRRDLKDLFTEYKSRLLQNEYNDTITWPYTFGSFKSGELIPKETRRYYRTLCENGNTLSDPFESEPLKSWVSLRSNETGNEVISAEEQLNAILNSRAWRWVSRYGRFKNRYLRRRPPRK
jgi:hypothetical protein